jgi:hypothetical protein
MPRYRPMSFASLPNNMSPDNIIAGVGILTVIISSSSSSSSFTIADFIARFNGFFNILDGGGGGRHSAGDNEELVDNGNGVGMTIPLLLSVASRHLPLVMNSVLTAVAAVERMSGCWM